MYENGQKAFSLGSFAPDPPPGVPRWGLGPRPPFRLALAMVPPPLANPGSATAHVYLLDQLIGKCPEFSGFFGVPKKML